MHPFRLLVVALSLSLSACGADDPSLPDAGTGAGGGGGGGSTTQTQCAESSDCPALSCTCQQGAVSSYQSCVSDNGVGTCGTCEAACADKGGVKPDTHQPGCLDPEDGTNSAFRGSGAVGSACDTKALSSACASGLCINDGTGQGFCSRPCSGEGDCNGLSCKDFVGSNGNTFRYCIDDSRTWCSR